MGIDACIAVRMREGSAPWVDSVPHVIVRVLEPGDEARYPKSTTHYVNVCSRMWDPDYRRGDWTRIAFVLFALLCDNNVHGVWYYGDNEDAHTVEPFHMGTLTVYMRAFMNGVE